MIMRNEQLARIISLNRTGRLYKLITRECPCGCTRCEWGLIMQSDIVTFRTYREAREIQKVMQSEAKNYNEVIHL